MANHFSDIMDQVLELPQSDRAILVNHLWQSLDQDHRLPRDEMDTVLTAYQRDSEIEAGSVQTYSLEEVLLELDGTLDKNNTVR